jgi:hypothetical protein
MSSRREPSLRAQAREHFRAAVRAGAPSQVECAGTPLSIPPPQAGEGTDQHAGRDESSPVCVPSLTERVRALYEAGVVPVREIAELAGVSERTLYKYAARGHWRRRVRRLDAGDAGGERAAASGADRAGRGAGGRFIPLAQAGLPHASGLKALDPAGARLAGEACERAQVLSEAAALAAVEAARERAARRRAVLDARRRERMLERLAGAFVELARLWAERAAQPAKPAAAAADERFARLAGRLGHAIIGQIERVLCPAP